MHPGIDLGQKQFGGFDYTIYGNENDCVDFRNSPIILQSSEFKDFWARFKLHGFICLSDYDVPFPELEDIGEGLVFRPRRPLRQSRLNISGRVPVTQHVWEGIAFIRQRLPRNQLSDPLEVCKTLREYGYFPTADWIKSHPTEYLAGSRIGFQVNTSDSFNDQREHGG
jgi:hypothetical protein